MSPLVEGLLVASGGALGGAARHGLNGLVTRRTGGPFPWGTLLVNVTGALAIGLLAGGAEALAPAPDARVWTFLVAGVLGSYTTVSSFSLQTLYLVRMGDLVRAGRNVALSFTLCLGAAGGGLIAARALLGG